MKILVFHSELGVLRGGGENFTRNLFHAFAEKGHDVSAVFIADRCGQYPIVLPGKITPIPLAGYWSRKLGQKTLSNVAHCIPEGTQLRIHWDRLQGAICWRTVRWHDRRFTRRVELEFESRWKEFDAAYVHGSPLLASRIAQYCPTILRLPGPVPPKLASMLTRVPIVCANGDALSQVRGFLGDHAKELSIGLDTKLFKPGPSLVRQRLGWTEQQWVVGYVGRLAYVKGVDLLVDAFKKMRKTIPQVRLLVVGAGEEEGKLSASLSAELREGLAHFEADVHHEQLAEWYRAMNLFVMPSRYENFSNALLEALSCGVPCLASDVGGNSRLVKNKGGWLFTHDSVDSLLEALNSIARNPIHARNIGAIGRKSVCDRYSWEASAACLEAIINSCLKKKVGTVCRL